jgi:recombination protein RecA
MERDKFEERKKDIRAGKEPKGSRTDGKAKINSQYIRQLLGPLQKSGSILIVINQTRENVGDGIIWDRKTHSGGKSLTFYACCEIWSSVVHQIKKSVNGKPRQIGTLCEVRTKKNRLSGKDREITIPILWSHGIDDIGACVDYLTEEKHWTIRNGMIDARELDFKGGREAVIHYVEEHDMRRDLQEMVRDVWDEIEHACEARRTNPYE